MSEPRTSIANSRLANIMLAAEKVWLVRRQDTKQPRVPVWIEVGMLRFRMGDLPDDGGIEFSVWVHSTGGSRQVAEQRSRDADLTVIHDGPWIDAIGPALELIEKRSKERAAEFAQAEAEREALAAEVAKHHERKERQRLHAMAQEFSTTHQNVITETGR